MQVISALVETKDGITRPGQSHKQRPGSTKRVWKTSKRIVCWAGHPEEEGKEEQHTRDTDLQKIPDGGLAEQEIEANAVAINT